MKKRIFPLIFLAILVSWGCFRKSSVKVPSTPAPAPAQGKAAPPPAITPPAIVRMPAPLESADIPKTIASPGNLELGELYFRSGNYSKAIGEYEAFFRNSPTAKGGDLALFHLGLSQALSTDSDRNFHRAEAAFKRLISEFPDSIYKNQAEFILGLQAQIDRLSSDLSERDDRIRKLSKELQVLKDIDLQRRPSRPNE